MAEHLSLAFANDIRMWAHSYDPEGLIYDGGGITNTFSKLITAATASTRSVTALNSRACEPCCEATPHYMKT
ncbi:MAG: hypothetical protein CMM16_03830 [Rhodospirillaceae bacterium]|nr:hypothetical protein [Rhodospirillaceae bacterium]